MSLNGYVPLTLISTFRRVRELASDIDTLVEALRCSQYLEVVPDPETGELMVGLVQGIPQPQPAQRTTLILRDVLPQVTEQHIRDIFTNPAHPVISIHPEIGSSWFVTFASEDACKEEFLRLQSGSITLEGQVVRARIKSESVPIVTKSIQSQQQMPYDMMGGAYPPYGGFPGFGGYPFPPFGFGGPPAWGGYDVQPSHSDRGGRGKGNGMGRGGRGGNLQGGRGNGPRKPYSRGGGVATLPKSEMPPMTPVPYPQLTPAPPGQVQRYARGDFLAVFESMRILHNGNLPICASMTDSEGLPCVLHGPNRDIESLPSMQIASHYHHTKNEGGIHYGSSNHNSQQQSRGPLLKGLAGADVVLPTNPSRPSFAQIAGKAPPPVEKRPRGPPPSNPKPQQEEAAAPVQTTPTPAAVPPPTTAVESSSTTIVPPPNSVANVLFNFGSNSLASRLRGGPQSNTPTKQPPQQQQTSLGSPTSKDDQIPALTTDDDDNWATHVMGQLRSKP
jgi:hypothetical protein